MTHLVSVFTCFWFVRIYDALYIDSNLMKVFVYLWNVIGQDQKIFLGRARHKKSINFKNVKLFLVDGRGIRQCV